MKGNVGLTILRIACFVDLKTIEGSLSQEFSEMIKNYMIA